MGEPLGRYIERNPLRAQLEHIKYPWEYEWSSARYYGLGEPDKLISGIEHPFWHRMGNSDEERMGIYQNYLMSEAERADDEELFRGNSPAIGKQSFKSNIQHRNGRLTSRKVGRPRVFSAK